MISVCSFSLGVNMSLSALTKLLFAGGQLFGACGFGLQT